MTLQSTETTEEMVKVQQSPSLARHVRHSTSNVSEEMEEVGYFYEIDHSRLPPDSPPQLRPCRVVMVTEKTEYNVSVRFPSRLSIREHFRDKASGELNGKRYPALDEKWEMGLNIAGQLLFRQIPTEEFYEQRNLPSFWSVQQEETEKISFSSSESGLGDLISKKGKCWSELKHEGLVRWGMRRKVRFINRYFQDDSEHLLTDVKEEEKGDEEETEEDVKLEFPETRTKSRKRKRYTFSRAAKVKREKQQQSNGFTRRILKNSKDRWSAERYKIAEENMLKILKSKRAVSGNPILRPELRLEARKKIGDTGLLDHLLKHMAGKVAPGGADRFRRRHNADGAMEYWLESAELVGIRREAGVQDPYWTPPLGWKPGDSPTQDPVCARELKLLKEDMAQMKRAMEELASKKRGEGLLTAGKDSSIVCQENAVVVHADSLHPLKKMHQELVIMKAKIDEELSKISYSLKGFEEETGELTSIVEEPEKKLLEPQGMTMGSAVLSVAGGSGEKAEGERRKGQGEKEKGVLAVADARRSVGVGVGVGEEEEGTKVVGGSKSEEKAAKIQRLKSGFRLCKPQGTFLWPSSVALSPPQAVVQVEDLLALPTPPSVSSSTTTTTTTTSPSLPPPPPPQQPLSPVKPLAEKRHVSLTIPHRTTTTLINLNELPSSVTASSTNNGSRRTIASAAAAPSQPNHTLTMADVLPRQGKNGKDVVNPWLQALSAGTESKSLIGYSQQWQQQLQRRGYSNLTPNTSLPMGLGTWLALSSPNSMDNSHRN